MSKAFTRESDDAYEDPIETRPLPTLPPGAKNYLTADGAHRLREELRRLIQVDRPAAASHSDPDTAKRRLRAIDQRIHHLEACLQSAEVVAAPPPPWTEVRFGAIVTVRDQHHEESHYRIVGIDEADPDRGWVSYLSPIARALLKARLGQRVRFRAPAGDQQLEIVGITHEAQRSGPRPTD